MVEQLCLAGFTLYEYICNKKMDQKCTLALLISVLILGLIDPEPWFYFDFKPHFLTKWLSYTLVLTSHVNIRFVHQSKHKGHFCSLQHSPFFFSFSFFFFFFLGGGGCTHLHFGEEGAPTSNGFATFTSWWRILIKAADGILAFDVALVLFGLITSI